MPLATATGAGAASRRIMGCTVIGGMLCASFLAIFLIPVIFYIIEKLGGEKHKTLKPVETTPAPDAPTGGGH
jgi:HAE1 family hydrophobic/amphiphilic exporter-1